ncbi:Gfo/Idh/MocA family protein [Dactylosporangium siamense]|uniref:Dehydrogenase n=1 Tax=Dactylosporangium siamense TaxID=685454 RepID=A0A919PK63_9ACTN|nr:Gfo/Idh/MocA family oxidoreductase [Dactylosporangium siamense]GIG45017.1 dehydrogenase [Dactylosporangium siamense]
MTRIKAGVIGTGFMGSVHARAIARAGAELVGVVSSRPEQAARLGAPCHRTLDTLLDTGVDVVHVCTPNHLHAEQTRQILAAGRHVVCEKPLATDPADAADLVSLASASGRVATVPFVYRFHPMVRHLRERIAAGDAGRLLLIRGWYLQDWLADPADTDWRVDPALGGPSRTFADIGVHWCDLAEFATGHRITRLIATTSTTTADRPTEDTAALLFETDQGATGSMTVSQVSLGRKNRLELFVDGDRTAYGFSQEEPDTLWTGTRDAVTLLPRGSGLMSPEALNYSRVPAGHPHGYQDCFDAFVADTYAAIAGAAPDGLPVFADGARAAALTAAVLRSAAGGTWVTVS